MQHSSSNSVALVTGATGYVGSRLVRRLVADGWQVHAIVRPASNVARLHGLAETWQFDGTIDSLHLALANARPTIVFHLASMFLAQHTAADIAPMVEANIGFGVALLESMAVNGVSRLVNTGTFWQHFNQEDYNPACLYAASKQAFEAMLCFYEETASVQAITLKLFDNYGPDDSRRKLIPLLLETARTGTALEMSPGGQQVDLVHVDDVVEAYLVAAQHLVCQNQTAQNEVPPHAKLDAKLPGNAFGVSSGEPLRLTELVELFERVRGVKLGVAWGRRPYRPREIMVPWNTYRPLPGWQPRIKLADGLRNLP